MNIEYKEETVFDYKDDVVFDGDILYPDHAFPDSVKMINLRNQSAYVDVTQDIRVLLIDRVEFRLDAPSDPRLNGIAYDDGNIAIVNTGYPADNGPDPDPEALVSTICHEIGHIITKSGHPDEEQGVAPLPGTDRTVRMLCSGPARAPAPSAKLLVKAEWDGAEDWLSSRPRGDL